MIPSFLAEEGVPGGGEAQQGSGPTAVPAAGRRLAPGAPELVPSPPPPPALDPSPPPPAPDSNLPLLSEALARAHSSAPSGALGRSVVVAFSDWRPPAAAKSSPAQEQQALLARSFSRTLAALRLPCLLGLTSADPHSAHEPLTRAALGALGEIEGGCAAFHAGTAIQSRAGARMGRWTHIGDLLAWGLDVLSLDLDVALLRNPVPYLGALLAKHPGADVLSSTDATNGRYASPPPGWNESAPDALKATWRYAILSRSDFGEAGAPVAATRWETAFPALPLAPEGRYVAKPELRRMDAWGVDFLLNALRTGEYELGLDSPSLCQDANLNVGMQLWRATPRARNLLAAVQAEVRVALSMRLREGRVFHDQPAFNAAVRAGSRFCASPPTMHLFSPDALCDGDPGLAAMTGGACLGVLGLAQWSNGLVYSLVRAHEQFNVLPFAMHATFTREKVLKLREEGLLRDDPGHYAVGDRPDAQRFLSYSPTLSPELFHSPITAEPRPGFYTWRHQFRLVQAQARSFRAALGLAVALNRTLVLPRVACVCQCSYAPGTDCAVEGQRVRLPHVCPTEHWLRLGPLRAFGHPFREPGFLERDLPAGMHAAEQASGPSRPARFSAFASHPSQVLPGALAVASAPHADGLGRLQEVNMESAVARKTLPRAELGMVALPEGLKSGDELAQLLQPRAAAARVLHFHDPVAAWRGFAEATTQERFQGEARKMLGSWCCLQEHPDGSGSAGPGLLWKMPYEARSRPPARPA